MEPDKSAIRDAASVIILRDRTTAPRVLMGQRGAKAAFMPSKFVFPGGAVDPDDRGVPLAAPIGEPCQARLGQMVDDDLSHALVTAAIRELWEETGLILGRQGNWPGVIPQGWQSFAERGYLPDAAPLQFCFRAITPPGRPRRFDARFFLLNAQDLTGDPDDFTHASDELSHLQWIPLDEIRSFDLPFITQIIMSEITARLDDPLPPENVPFFQNSDEESAFLRIRERPMTLDD